MTRLRRSRRSSSPDASAKIAMISDAVTMSNPDSRIGPLLGPPSPVTICRSARSSTSTTRRHVMFCGPNPGIFPLSAILSVIADSKLCADATACASPVKWMFTSSCGSTSEAPPPVPPPLMPNMGPSEGSLRVAVDLCPSCAIA